MNELVAWVKADREKNAEFDRKYMEKKKEEQEHKKQEKEKEGELRTAAVTIVVDELDNF